MKTKKNSITILSLLFLLAFSIKIMPVYKGYNAPFGYVDTASHISSALDISEGRFDSMLHPWWHLKNHFLINGYDIVDRNAASFFYPPFIHLLLAFFFLFMHPGIASIICISFLYSLSVPATFFLCESFGLKDKYALVSAALTSISVPLLYSQNYGFWTFLTASNFIIFSWVFLRLKSRKSTFIGIIFYFLALTTHWMFLSAAIAIGLAEFFINKNKEAKFYLISAILISIPFFAYISYLHNPFDYVKTYFSGLIIPNYFLVTLAAAGLVLNIKKYKEMLVFSFLALSMFAAYNFFGVHFIFADMVQFIFPFFVSFYAGALLQNASKNYIKFFLIALILIAAASDLTSINNIFKSGESSITKEEFNGLLALRKEFEPNEMTILATERGLLPWWITLVGKDSKILYPDTYENENMEGYSANYILGELKTKNRFIFYKISRKGNNLVLEENAALTKNR